MTVLAFLFHREFENKQRAQGQDPPNPELPLWAPRSDCHAHFTAAQSDVPGNSANRLCRRFGTAELLASNWEAATNKSSICQKEI